MVRLVVVSPAALSSIKACSSNASMRVFFQSMALFPCSYCGGSATSAARAFSSNRRVSASCFFKPSTTCAGALARKLSLPSCRSAEIRPFSYFAMSFVKQSPMAADQPKQTCCEQKQDRIADNGYRQCPLQCGHPLCVEDRKSVV